MDRYIMKFFFGVLLVISTILITQVIYVLWMESTPKTTYVVCETNYQSVLKRREIARINKDEAELNKTGESRIQVNNIHIQINPEIINIKEIQKEQIPDMETVNKLRLSRFSKWCSAKKGYTGKVSTLVLPSWIYFSDKFKFILMVLPKTGLTSWQFILWNNSLPEGSSDWKNATLVSNSWREKFLGKYGILNYSRYPRRREINQIFNTYYTFLSVRHPLIRLEAAFRDKIATKEHYQKLYGTEILKKYRKRTKDNAKIFVTGQGVRFDEFLKYVMANPIRDEHWRKVTLLRPCLLNPKYIGKTETASLDMEYIIHNHLAGRGDPVRINMHSDTNVERPQMIKLELFSNLTDPQYFLDKMMNIYGDDMKLFGYDYAYINNTVYAFCQEYTESGICI